LGFNCAFDGPNSGVWTRQKAEEVAEQYDVICFAGCGQLIPWDTTPSGWAWQGDVDISPIIGKKVIALAIGVNERHPSAVAGENIASLCNAGAIFTGRDDVTTRWLSQYCNDVMLVPDLAFLSDRIQRDSTGKIGILVGKPIPGQLPEMIAQISGKDIVLFTHSEFDLYRNVWSDVAEVLQPTNIDELAEIYATCDAIVGHRYHNGILALVHRKPFVWVIRNIKTGAFADTWPVLTDHIVPRGDMTIDEWAEQIVARVSTPLSRYEMSFADMRKHEIRNKMAALLERRLSK